MKTLLLETSKKAEKLLINKNKSLNKTALFVINNKLNVILIVM